jgi:hypothetical protein
LDLAVLYRIKDPRFLGLICNLIYLLAV